MDSSTGPTVMRTALIEPYISDRAVYPALHSIVDGLSPWELGVSAETRAKVSALRWSIVRFERTIPVENSPVVATDTITVVEVSVIGSDGAATSMGTSECMLRTELDGRSLADRQLSGQGWLLPVGYTIIISA